MPQPPVELLVCTRCRRGQEVGAEGIRPGAELHDRLAADPPPGVTVTAVECLSNCDHGCTIALRGPGRWTYVYGRFDESADLAELREGAQKYAASPDGLVPWRERPQHFRKNCIARIPPLDHAPQTPKPPNLSAGET